MPVEVASAVADGIRSLRKPIVLIWHGGEPLTTGTSWFQTLVEVFEDLRGESMIRHAIQTNATLLTTDWCELLKSYQFTIGVSIDGPCWLNSKRRDWVGRSTFERTMRGISVLKSMGMKFNVIAVVSGDSLLNAEELYKFFVDLGCSSLAINVVENEGQDVSIPDDNTVQEFWERLFRAWIKCPVLPVREFSKTLNWMRLLLSTDTNIPRNLDLIPTVSASGDIVLLSPELADAHAPEYGHFIVGRVPDEPFAGIIERAPENRYIIDFLKGVELCANTCSYYSFCGGGQAANKFFEIGSLVSSQTAFCRNSRIRLVDAVLGDLERRTQ